MAIKSSLVGNNKSNMLSLKMKALFAPFKAALHRSKRSPLQAQPVFDLDCLPFLVVLVVLVLAVVAFCFVLLFSFFLIVALEFALPRQVLHLERIRLCSHMPAPPHSLHS
jgi:hypothetical protein